MNVAFEIYTVHDVHVGKTPCINMVFLLYMLGMLIKLYLTPIVYMPNMLQKTTYAINVFRAVHDGQVIVAMRALVV